MITTDSVVFVTGANRGLGLAFVQTSLERGARKIYAGRRNPRGVSGPGIEEIQIDVTDPASVAKAAARYGDTTLLVNNAGIGRVHSKIVDPAMIDIAREVFETNYFGTIRVSLAFAAILGGNGGGAIVNVLSDASWLALSAALGVLRVEVGRVAFYELPSHRTKRAKTLVVGCM